MNSGTLFPIFDAVFGEQAKATGMARAGEGAGEEWAAEAEAVVLRLAAEKPTFTSDDIWAAGLSRPSEPRALGAVLNRLARLGRIYPSGRYVKTTQASRHRAPIAVWVAAPVWVSR